MLRVQRTYVLGEKVGSPFLCMGFDGRKVAQADALYRFCSWSATQTSSTSYEQEHFPSVIALLRSNNSTSCDGRLLCSLFNASPWFKNHGATRNDKATQPGSDSKRQGNTTTRQHNQRNGKTECRISGTPGMRRRQMNR